jgi:hypothetical protein
LCSAYSCYRQRERRNSARHTAAAEDRDCVPVKSIVSEVTHLVRATAGEATINTATLRN